MDQKQTQAQAQGKALEKPQESISQRFANVVMREYSGQIGKIEMTPYQRRLAQNLFIKTDQALKDLERKRQEKNPNNLPIVWANINLEKLAVDAVRRIELGLDALIPNHIDPIPYFNERTKKYDIDLRIGYAGKDYYRRQMAVDPPENVIYELVHENDVFRPIKASFKNAVESYEFEIPNPFDRGKVIGGFAYVVYGDPKKNRLYIVTEDDFKKSKDSAQAKNFWNDYPEAMQFKTIVNRVTGKIRIDPEKVNASFRFVEEQEDSEDAARVQADINEKANKGEIVDVETGEIQEAPVNGAGDIPKEPEKEATQGQPQGTPPPKTEEAKPQGRQPGF